MVRRSWLPSGTSSCWPLSWVLASSWDSSPWSPPTLFNSICLFSSMVEQVSHWIIWLKSYKSNVVRLFYSHFSLVQQWKIQEQNQEITESHHRSHWLTIWIKLCLLYKIFIFHWHGHVMARIGWKITMNILETWGLVEWHSSWESWKACIKCAFGMLAFNMSFSLK